MCIHAYMCSVLHFQATCRCKDKAYASCVYVYRNVYVHMRMNLGGELFWLPSTHHMGGRWGCSWGSFPELIWKWEWLSFTKHWSFILKHTHTKQAVLQATSTPRSFSNRPKPPVWFSHGGREWERERKRKGGLRNVSCFCHKVSASLHSLPLHSC